MNECELQQEQDEEEEEEEEEEEKVEEEQQEEQERGNKDKVVFLKQLTEWAINFVHVRCVFV